MGRDSKIEWTTHTFNPWRGCTKVSAGCAHCYAEALSRRNPKVLGEWGPRGTRVVAAESRWREPLAWDRAAARAGKRHRVFCASLADVFEDWRGTVVGPHGAPPWVDPIRGGWHEGDDGPTSWRRATLDDARRRLVGLIGRTPHLDWLLLTKRPENVMRLWPNPVPGATYLERWGPAVFANVWLGVSCEDQATADARIPHLLATPACVRFLSCEPLLGPLNLRTYLSHGNLHWVIVGGESGPGARPMDEDWVRHLRDQCRAAGAPFFYKQKLVAGRKVGLPELDGRAWDEFPAASTPSTEAR